MANSFTNVQLDPLTRTFGGSTTGTADPYISGYHFIWFEKLPAKLATYTNFPTQFSAVKDNGSIQKFLSGACLSVTPPGMTINRAEMTGLGGIKWVAPTNTDFGNTVTMRFLEFSGLPVLSIFHGWARMIREYRNGVTSLEGNDGYTKSEYSGTCFYWTTKPDGLTVEYSACFAGMWPTKDPQDSYTGDLTAVDKLELDMEFAIDWSYHEDWVITKCQAMAQTFKQSGLKSKGGLGQFKATGMFETAS